MSSPLVAPDSKKATLRAAALAARDALGDAQRAAAAQAVAARGLPFEIAPGTVVAGYSPIRSEIDPAAADARARRAGRAAGAAGGRWRAASRCAFRAWSPGDRLMLRAARHSRAVAGGGRDHSRHHAGAARGVRPRRPPHRLRRRTLRLHPCAFAQGEGRSSASALPLPCRKSRPFRRCRTTWRWIMC